MIKSAINRVRNLFIAPERRHKITVYNPRLDDVIAYLTDSITPTKLAGLVKGADAGDLASWVQVCEEIADKDDEIHSSLQTRRLAITGLEWDIEPDPRAKDAGFAQKTADYCRDYLTDIPTFGLFLKHNASAFGPGVAVTEKVFEGTQIMEFAPVYSSRLLARYDRPGFGPGVRILTEEDMHEGIPADAAKFVTFTPHSPLGLPTRSTPLRPVLMLYLAKSISMKDWMQFVERFGMPIPYAQVDSGATEVEKREVFYALKNLASGSAGIISKAVEIAFAEPGSRSDQPFQPLQEFCNKQIRKAILGQTLSADTTGGTGTYAAAKVHDQVRRDILEADIEAEAEAIRSEILCQIVAFRFGSDAPVPVWRRPVPDPVDYAAVETRFRTARDSGLPVSRKQARALLELDEPESLEDELKPPQPSNPSFGGLFGGPNGQSNLQ